ncbi:hypothetical protein MKX36_10475 [Paenibacillus sp. FSL W8-0439]|uniref:hypothetical protein n=1 Tax=Paenibacillus TaxID=44249 RepID=UPI0030F85A9D
MSHKRVQRMMQRDGLQCRVRMKKRKVTGQENLLKRQLHAEAPLQKLVTDITYLNTLNQLPKLTKMLLHNDQGSVCPSHRLSSSSNEKRHDHEHVP